MAARKANIWVANSRQWGNRKLEEGDSGLELDTGVIKIGDGHTRWGELAAATSGQEVELVAGVAGGWTQNDVGNTGPTGATGPAGANGIQGIIGLTGPAVANGVTGAQADPLLGVPTVQPVGKASATRLFLL